MRPYQIPITKLVPSIFFLLLLLPLTIRAQENQIIEIEVAIGETKRVDFTGINPFISDDSIASINLVAPTRLSITGLRGGATHVYYWQEGALSQITVNVLTPDTLISTLLTPSFRPGKPFFQYFLGNSSLYDRNTFYNSASSTHSLVSDIPVGASRHLRTFSSYSHTDFLEEGSLSRAGIIYLGPHLYMESGEASPSFSQTLKKYTGAAIMGSHARYTFPRTRRQLAPELTLFGGFSRPDDLLQGIEISEQVYGTKLGFSRYRPGSISYDYANVGAMGYQAKEGETIRPVGMIEASQHVSDRLALGGAFAHSQEGFVAALNPYYESPRDYVETSYTFVPQGVTDFASTATTDDEHETNMNAQHMFSDNQTFLQAGLSHRLILPKQDSTTLKLNDMGSSLQLIHQKSFRNAWSVNYALARSDSAGEKTLTNQFGGGVTHPVSRQIYANHSLSYTRNDLDVENQNLGFTSLAYLETSLLRYALSASGATTFADTADQNFTVANDVELSFNRWTLALNLSYQVPSLDDVQHQLQFSQGLTYQPTRVDLVSLVNSGTLTAGPDPSVFQSALAIQYQRFFGPGVESDSLVKKILKGGTKAFVRGTVFLDTNYNMVFDEPDKPLAGVWVRLDKKKVSLTDEQGHFSFSAVKGGEHSLTIDKQTLKIGDETEEITRQGFTSTGAEDMNLPIPVLLRRAAVRVQYLLDTNDNQRPDPEDSFVNIKKTYLILPSGERRTFYQGARMSGIIRGLEVGKNIIGFDFLDMPEDVSPLDPLEKTLTVTQDQEYSLSFLFKPIRSLRGRVVWDEAKRLPQNLNITLGTSRSQVDARGYFWLQDLKPGDHKMQINNLPKGYCISSDLRSLNIPRESFTLVQDLTLIQDCDQ